MWKNWRFSSSCCLTIITSPLFLKMVATRGIRRNRETPTPSPTPVSDVKKKKQKKQKTKQGNEEEKSSRDAHSESEVLEENVMVETSMNVNKEVIESDEEVTDRRVGDITAGKKVSDESDKRSDNRKPKRGGLSEMIIKDAAIFAEVLQYHKRNFWNRKDFGRDGTRWMEVI